MLKIGISPCPNDTFMFHALATGKQTFQNHKLVFSFHDVETLNQQAFQQVYDFTKLSFHSYLLNQERYQLLPCACAMGFGCGPILLGKKEYSSAEIKDLRLGIPGKLTTAHLLFQLWQGQEKTKNKKFMLYHEILPLLDKGEIDCGIIIHESRFTYEKQGFKKIIDLGAWWEEKTGLPIPLGCVAAKKTLPSALIDNFSEALRQSIITSRKQPLKTLPLLREYATELSEKVLLEHVKTFVNEFSLELGASGKAAIAKMQEMAISSRLLKC